MSYKINPDRNKPWNDLPDLPITSILYEDIDIYKQLGNSKAALGRLQGRSIAIPNQGMLINSISLQEAKASSAIENIFTTDDELYRAYSENEQSSVQGAAKEVLNYRKALWIGYEHLKRESFDEGYFVKMYQIISQFSDGIRTPIAQIYIKEGGTGPNAGKPFYTPPRGSNIVETKLANLIDFLNDDKKHPVDPLLKMAIGHFQFEAIHPFRDGNGRTGRIFNIHYLTKKGLLDYPILYLSRYIIDNKEDYYAGLAGITQRGSWKSWLLYMLKAVEMTSNLTYNKITDIIAAKEAILAAVIERGDILRPEKLVEALFSQPFTKIKHFTSAGVYAENTARKYLEILIEMGVLEKRIVQGNSYYLNLELYRILSE
ncbi:Filamentation induced by cAMP protein Fic [Pedobacter cryoconitis]|uniref:Filamentation induced by cAMP protein Fic n=1 Tax=Pedobacter cryoconitis TaxID=188932 RepID=A0A127VG91_9SPHI|nr:Fic family protein [Pedobacter cryoconitis]AMQ00252.1 Filamentation induced by cAMP protein Fic [Pedobacter cryoconitis]